MNFLAIYLALNLKWEDYHVAIKIVSKIGLMMI